MRLSLSAPLLLASLATLASCERREAAPPPVSAAVPPPAPAPEPAPAPAADIDRWLGPWTGPEGTGLLLSKTGDGYGVKIQSLDGPDSYTGRAAGDHIEFERQGKTESIRAATGAETGMKWLADKKDCLVIQPGEGFCRD